MSAAVNNHREVLITIARRSMLEHGLLPDFSVAVLRELSRIESRFVQLKDLPNDPGTIRDLRDQLWVSIDNDDSLDLDQVSTAERMPGGKIKVLVAIADVDSLVEPQSAIDGHARQNTTSVYTPAMIFSMLPEKLSTDLTSLAQDKDRPSMIVQMVFNNDGSLQDSEVYRAVIRNHAKLAYGSVSAWLVGSGPEPNGIRQVKGLAENLKLQDEAAQRIQGYRHMHGALSLETVEGRPVFDGDQVLALEFEETNRAKQIIEDFMIAANGVTARFLTTKKFPSIRRVVRSPKRWDRIVEIASEHGFDLPPQADSKSLEEFLLRQKLQDPLHFPDLSLSVIKLLGAGEYVAEPADGYLPGHFGLAVKDYSHSTAPNRRYTDLITQRLIKSALAGEPALYSTEDLEAIAVHCTRAEDAAHKVERQVGKSAAALLLESKIGDKFDSIVTGSADKGTWVRLLSMPVEGKLVQGYEDLDVGRRVRVQLVGVDVERGFIDFRKL